MLTTMKSKEEMKGFDFGEMMLESNAKGKFQNWNDIRVFEVCKSGMYIVFRRGDTDIVKVLCHEEIDSLGTTRFKKMEVPKSPIDGWKSRMVWKYRGGKANTVAELTAKLQELDILKKDNWRVVGTEKPLPMINIMTKKSIVELARFCERNQFLEPTTEEAFGVEVDQTSETMEKAKKWYQSVVEGNVGKGKKRSIDSI